MIYSMCVVVYCVGQDYWAPNGSNVHYSRENIDVRVSACAALRNHVL